MATTTTYQYFIKGDVSGIQDFIFNVKSEKAARVLKARSVFVEVLTFQQLDKLNTYE
jgi:CRISPR/Cas system-associated protein Cas10 (large subunit of type III CRISPR-Cas system)